MKKKETSANGSTGSPAGGRQSRSEREVVVPIKYRSGSPQRVPSSLGNTVTGPGARVQTS